MKKVFLLTVLFLCLLSLGMTSCGNANHEHTFDEWEQISESTCTKQGEAIRRCTVKDCDYTETKSIDLKNHDYENSITSPTKEKDGYTTHTCKNCAYVLVDTYVPAIGSANLEYDHVVTDENVSCIITGIGDCKDTDIYIPSYIGKYPVVAIAEDAFERCTSIKRVVVPKGIVEIGRSAFSNCINLEEITISDTVQRIDTNAFFSCYRLKNVYISDLTAWCKIKFGSADANPTYFAEKLFLNNQLLTSLTIPDKITEVGDFAFVNCTSITEILIHEGVTYIGCQTFSNCGIISIIIPDSVKKIQVAAFMGCIKLTSIKLPSNLTEIEMDVFYGCKFLKEIDIPKTVIHIHSGAFGNCNSLITISIPKSVNKIDTRAFENCSKLERIIFESTNNWLSYENYNTIGVPIDVSDPTENATIFTNENNHWEKK